MGRFFCGFPGFVVGSLLVVRAGDAASREAGVGLAVINGFLRSRAGLGTDATLGEVALAAGILSALLPAAALLLMVWWVSPLLRAQDWLQQEGLAGGSAPP